MGCTKITKTPKFVEPKTLDDAIRKAIHWYEKGKEKIEEHEVGRGKPRGRFDPRKKVLRFVLYRNRQRNVWHEDLVQDKFKHAMLVAWRPIEPM